MIISVNTLFPVIWVLISSILVLSVLGWLEIRRNQKRLALRLFALLISVFSIACLILNPALRVRKSSDIILLTPHYEPNVLDSLLNLNPKSQVYKLQTVRGTSHAVEIQNYRALRELHGNLFILGEGLPQYMLEYIDTSSLQYFPSSEPEGFIGINSSKLYTVNQRTQLEGIIQERSNTMLTLTGPGVKEDSIRITGTNPQQFSLTFVPKAAGLYLYTLATSDSAGKVQYTEQVPVQVKEQKPLSILFLCEYPSAEIRFLKNFLEKRNHKLTLRYKISKDKYRTEFINTPQISIGRLREEILQRFDLVLTDASSLASLSAGETQELKEAVKNGLGLLTLINTSSLPKEVNNLLALTVHKIKNDSAYVVINHKHLKIPATPVILSSAKNIFAIHQEPSGRIVSGYYPIGFGKSGFQLLTNTFSLELAGEKEKYAELWSGLIGAVARKEIKKYDLTFTTPFPYYPDEPVEFKIVSGGEQPRVRIEAAEISLVEDPLVKNVWYGRIWAGLVGWNSLTVDQDSSQHNFFVSQPNAWKSLQISNQQKSAKKISSKKIGVTERVVAKPVPKIIFFLLFLFSAGYLWLAPKR